MYVSTLWLAKSKTLKLDTVEQSISSSYRV